jgi:adenosylmethionine-8-amino-7-oxononanoate aminotransferase
MSKINTSSENVINITQAANQIPGRPHRATVWRWILNGLHGIRLESVKVGGRRFTSEEAIERFIARTTAVANGEQPPACTRQEQERAIRSAEQVVREHGI